MTTNELPVPTEEQIVSALRTTGFLFEQEIADRLGGATTGWAFEDQDSGVSREIDIYKPGAAGSFEGDRYNSITWHVVGECKNYRWPWIAVEREWDSWKYESSFEELAMTTPMKIRLNADEEGSMSLFSKRGEPGFYDAFSQVRYASAPRAVQLIKLNKKGGG